MRLFLFFLTTVFLLSPYSTFSQHKDLTKSNFEYAVKTSDLIFEGKVIYSESFIGINQRDIYTVHTIRVSKIFKGGQQAYIDIVTMGGEVDGRIQELTHTRTTHTGVEGLFLVRSNMDKNLMKEPFNWVFCMSSVIEYKKRGQRNIATSGRGTFYDIYKELYEPIETAMGTKAIAIEPNSIEKEFINKIEASLSTAGSSVTIVEFGFDNFNIQGTDEIEFDLVAKSNINGLKLGTSEIILDYSAEAFGSNVIANNKAEVTAASILIEAEITPFAQDKESNKVEIFLPSECSPAQLEAAKFATLTQNFHPLVHVKLEVENIIQTAILGLDAFAMDGNVEYYDDENEECVPVDEIVVSDDSNPFAAATIFDFFPKSLTAGTGDTLTVIGEGFGSGGKFMFSNANNGGVGEMTAAVEDFGIWSDTMITVRVPTREAIFPGAAGSGKIRVEPDSSQAFDTTGLEIRYAVLNTRIDEGISATEARRLHRTDGFDMVQDSSITISLAKSVLDSTANAIELFEEVLCSWTEKTGISWQLNPVVYIDSLVPDSVNIVRFVDSTMIMAGAFAVTTGSINKCIDPFALKEIRTVSQFSIKIRGDLSTISDTLITGWYYGLGDAPAGKMNLYNVMLHEFGHVHGLQHVNDEEDIMYYASQSGAPHIDLNNNNVAGGIDVLKTGLDELGSVTSNCDIPVTEVGVCIITSTKEKELNLGNVSIYPNPVSNDFTLSIENYIGGLSTIMVYNIVGQLILTREIGNKKKGNYTFRISMANQPTGIYFVSLKKDKLYHLGTIHKI